MGGCMETGKRIQILLSTYNGERYLREQLDSFIKQDNYSEIKILIRDDGSEDGTAEILREYEDKEGFEILYGLHVGITSSYKLLLQKRDKSCEYIAFSDQDDVWLPNKLTIAIQKIESCSNPEIPTLFASRSLIVNEQLAPIGKSILPVYGLSFFNAMVQNICPGHTQVMNRKLCDWLQRGDISRAHALDWWTYLLASGAGQVVFSEECTVLHRQHKRNAVGYQLDPVRLFFTRLKRVRSNEAPQITRQLKYFVSDYRDIIFEQYRLEAERFIDSQDSIRSRIAYAMAGKCFRQTWVESLLVRCLYITGKYRIKD